jgi:hypothetical protein
LHGTALPDFVKQAEAMTKEASASLPSEAFADRYHRAFPIDSAPNVYVSNAFFINKKAALEELWGKNFITEVEERIKKASEIFGIQEDITRYNSELNVKEATDYSEDFVASFNVGGQSYELFPFKTAADLLKQAEQFNKNLKNYPFGWRKTIAENFVKKAEELGVSELPDTLCKYAGLFYPDTRLFETELKRRINKIANEEAKKRYEDCLSKVASATSRDDYYNVCAEAYNIEKNAGVYDKPAVFQQLGDIVDKTFTLSVYKVAEELQNVVHMAGDVFSIPELQKISKDIYKEAFGVDIDPMDTGTLRDTLPTMPLSDVALFKELSGVRPL